jgi:hypothetical protein
MMAAQAPRAATQSAAPAGYGAAAKPVQALSQMGMVAAPAEDVDDFLHDIAMLEEHRDFAALARGLATHARNAEAAVAACRSLGLICRADNRNEVARSAALHVVAAMDAHAKDGAVQAEACAALAMMALNSQEGKTQILDAGAFPRIAEAMEVHDEDRQVQAMACYAIMSATNRATRAAIIEANAASCIILAALRYPVDFYVQDAAWWALQRILKDMTPEASVTCTPKAGFADAWPCPRRHDMTGSTGEGEVAGDDVQSSFIGWNNNDGKSEQPRAGTSISN